MHLALVLYGDLNFLSGGFLYDRRLVDYLRRQGVRVEVISLPWRVYPRGLLDNLSPALHRWLAGLSPDLLLQDELAHPSLFLVNRRLRPGKKLAAVVHHLRCDEPRASLLNRLYAQVEGRYLATLDACITNSRATLASVRRRCGRELPGVVAPPGIQDFPRLPGPAEIAARVQEPGPRRLLFVGNVIPRKGLHLLVRALAGLRAREWHLTVAGNLTLAPGYVRRLRQRLAAAGLASRVEFTGLLPAPELARHLARSHVLVVPSLYEGFGICYLEGMAFGLPAIGSEAGGAPEIITPGRDGFLVPPGEVAALAACLERLLTDDRLLLEMSLAARERFLAHPTWEESLEGAYRLLHSLADSP
jgi:glycosyltransferase involved in cell wall biosynthesis